MIAFFGFLAMFLGVIFLALGTFAEGFRRGYSAGRKDAEEWIVHLESDVSRARQEIWREK